MAQQKANFMHANGRVNTDAAILVAGSGNWSVVRNGAGDYTITLNDLIDSLEANVQITARTASRIPCIAAQTDSTIQVTFLSDAGLAADAVFDFLVCRVAG